MVGLHDNASWELTKKSLVENPQSALGISDSKAANHQQLLANHNLLSQNVQTEHELSRLEYADTSYTPNYDFNNRQDRVKLSSKLLVFDFNFSIFEDKNRIYATKKLDFKDEILNKSVFHTHYLFSDLSLTARNYLLTFSDRFLTKFSIPDYDSAKRTVRLIYNFKLNLNLYFIKFLIISSQTNNFTWNLAK